MEITDQNTSVVDSDGPAASLFIGNLRSDIPKDELHTHLLALLASVETGARDIEIRRKSSKKPTYAFVQLEDQPSLDNAIARLNGSVSTSVGIQDQAIVVAPKVRHGSGASKTTIKLKNKKRKVIHQKQNRLSGPLQPIVGSNSHAQTIFKERPSLPPIDDSKVGTLSHFGVAGPSSSLLKGEKFYIVGQKLGTEDRLVEYKRGHGRYLDKAFKDHLRKYICAFLNSEGGTLVIGVSDDCVVCGVECSDSREDQLRQDIDAVVRGFSPNIFPDAYDVNFVPVHQKDKLPLTLCSPHAQPNQLTPHPETEATGPSNNLTVSDNENSSSTADSLQSARETSNVLHINGDCSSLVHVRNLKVIEISVKSPKFHEKLYENDKGAVYMRMDGSVRGPLRASEIMEWMQQHQQKSDLRDLDFLQKENESLKNECQRKNDEIERNVKLVDELVKQKEFIDDQHQLKVEELRRKEQELQEKLKTQISIQESISRTNSKVCCIL